MKALLAIFLLFIAAFNVMGQSCPAIDIVGLAADKTCAGQYLEPGFASMPTVAANSKIFSFSFEFKVTGTCTGNPTDTRDAITLKAFDGTALVKVFVLRYKGAGNYVADAIDSTNTVTQIAAFTADTTDSLFRATVTVDLSAKTVNIVWLSKTQYLHKLSSTISYAANLYWAAKQGTIFFGEGDLLSYSIHLRYMKYSNDAVLFPLLISSDLTSRPFALYSMYEVSANSLSDGTNLIGRAYFGDSTATVNDLTKAPTANGMGVKFTATTQYIKLPSTPVMLPHTFGVPVSASLLTTLVSVAFSFSVNLDAIAAGNLFSRVSSANVNVYSVRINADGKVEAVMGTTVLATSTNALTTNTWTQIDAYFMSCEGRVFASLGINGVSQGTFTDINPLTTLAITEAGTDVVKIGGFTGTIENFVAIGNASPILATAAPALCTPASCLVENGITSECIIPKCTANQFNFMGSCQVCHADCATCRGPGANSCLTCKDAAKQLSQGQCTTPTPVVSTPTTSTPTTITPTTTTTTEVITQETGLSSGQVVGIVLGSIAVFFFFIVLPVGLIYRHKLLKGLSKNQQYQHAPSPHGVELKV